MDDDDTGLKNEILQDEIPLIESKCI